MMCVVTLSDRLWFKMSMFTPTSVRLRFPRLGTLTRQPCAPRRPEWCMASEALRLNIPRVRRTIAWVMVFALAEMWTEQVFELRNDSVLYMCMSVVSLVTL